MTFIPLENPEDMTPERRENMRICRGIRDMYWQREKAEYPEDIVDIDRKFIKFLLQVSESDILVSKIGLTRLEIDRAKKLGQITESARCKLRIYAECFVRDIRGD